MRHSWSFVVGIALSLCANAGEFVVAAKSEQRMEPREAVTVLVDPSRTLTIDQVRALPAERFTAVHETPAPDHRNTYWIRLPMRNATGRDIELSYAIPWWDHVETYLVRESRLESLPASGLTDNLSAQDPMAGRVIRLARDEPVLMYLRVERDKSYWCDPGFVPVFVPRADTLERGRVFMFHTGLFFGILLGLGLLHLLLSAQMRDSAYVWYGVYLTALAVSLVGQMGSAPSLLNQFYFPEHAMVGLHVKRMSDLLAWGALIFFTSAFLEWNKTHPRLRWLPATLVALLVLETGLWAIAGARSESISALLLVSPLLLLASAWRWYAGFKPARLMTIGLLVLVAGLIIMELPRQFGVDPLAALPRTGLGQTIRAHTLWVGASIYALVFGLALGDRYLLLQRALRDEREARQALLQEQAALLEREVAARTAELSAEKSRGDQLLANILPATIAAELRAGGMPAPRRFDEVTVAFTDFKGFTNLVATLPPQKVVAELNALFQDFDDILDRHGVEKIKTIGDAYMIAAGVPEPCEDHARRCANALFDMLALIETRNARQAIKWNMRAGMHSGAVVAGVVGKRKFTYDLWGDTVNIASRMEGAGEPGRINVSAYTMSLLEPHCRGEHRGQHDAKGKGAVDMYFLLR